MAAIQVAAAKATAAKTSSASSAFAGKSLGLGLGVGVWGPVILGVLGAAAIYGYIRSREAEASQSDEEMELAEAIAGT